MQWHLAAIRVEVATLRLAQACRKYAFDPNQPRIPAGQPGAGEWTDGARIGRTRVAANTPRGGRGSRVVTIGGQQLELTPGQAARLAAAEARADRAIAQVRERDPNWRATPGLVENAEGAILRSEDIGRRAEARFAELQRVGIGPGRFAAESIPARGPGRDFTAEERREINRIGREYGCHTCGARDPGSMSGTFYLDHQLPNAWNPGGRDQRIYPHCALCSARQGNWLLRNRRID